MLFGYRKYRDVRTIIKREEIMNEKINKIIDKYNKLKEKKRKFIEEIEEKLNTINLEIEAAVKKEYPLGSGIKFKYRNHVLFGEVVDYKYHEIEYVPIVNVLVTSNVKFCVSLEDIIEKDIEVEQE
jgi:hypothetical protein